MLLLVMRCNTWISNSLSHSIPCQVSKHMLEGEPGTASEQDHQWDEWAESFGKTFGKIMPGWEERYLAFPKLPAQGKRKSWRAERQHLGPNILKAA